MKILVLIISLIPAFAYSQVSTKITAVTNYISRGVSFSNGGSSYASAGLPVVQGSLDYAVGDFSASLFTSSIDSINLGTYAIEKDTEIDYILNYSKKVNSDLTLGASATHYSFMRNDNDATTAESINAMYSFARVDLAYTRNYSGLQTSMTYTLLSLFFPVSEKLMFSTALGRTSWDDESKVGMSSYNDYKVSLRMTISPSIEAEMAYTNTYGRKDLVVTQQEIKTDKALTFSISSSFGL